MYTRLSKHVFWWLMGIGIVDIIAVKLYLYWTVWWFDIPMHFSGGLWVGLLSVWLWHIWKSPIQSRRQALVVGLSGAIIIGILWEIFELAVGVTAFSDGIHYVTDTLSDLSMDTLGGITSSFYSYYLITTNHD